MNYIVAAGTDIGTTKDTNQDSFNVKVMSAKYERLVLSALCDGMGGLSKGEMASGTVAKAFGDWAVRELPGLLEQGLNDAVVRAEWEKIVLNCNERIRLYGQKNGIKLGTTLTAMLITDQQYYIMNVGDTRAYEITSSIRQLTKDQTVVQREADLGNIRYEDMETDTRRSILLQCIGVSEKVYPDFYTGETKRDAVYLLCTDGFRHEITPDEIAARLNPDRMTDADGMKKNIDILIDLDKKRLEKDNISAVSIRTF